MFVQDDMILINCISLILCIGFVLQREIFHKEHHSDHRHLVLILQHYWILLSVVMIIYQDMDLTRL